MSSGLEAGELFVVSAPSGAGKTTLCRAVCARLSNLVYSVSHTTREARPGELNGQDYFFVSEEAFQKMRDGGQFLECAQVYRYWYGTSREWVRERLREGLDVIMDVDVQGAEQLRGSGLPGHYVFVLPPSWHALEQRLASRGKDSPHEMEMRLRWAQREMMAWEGSDFVIVNEDLDEATRDLEAVIRAERCRTQRRRRWMVQESQRWTPSGG